jgi:hypothetical protein
LRRGVIWGMRCRAAAGFMTAFATGTIGGSRRSARQPNWASQMGYAALLGRHVT